jgi:transcriptional repressor NrdR
VFVVKRHGNREAFDREKIFRGVVKAFDKRPVSIELVNQLADDVEREVRRKEVSEISSKTIGRMVLKRLKAIDKVTWLRFASVYFELNQVEEFEKLIEKITNT